MRKSPKPSSKGTHDIFSHAFAKKAARDLAAYENRLWRESQRALKRINRACCDMTNLKVAGSSNIVISCQLKTGHKGPHKLVTEDKITMTWPKGKRS